MFVVLMDEQPSAKVLSTKIETSVDVYSTMATNCKFRSGSPQNGKYNLT